MDDLYKSKKSKRTFLILKAFFIASGIFQGVSVVLTIPLFNNLFLGEFKNVMTWLLYIGILALLCFITHFIGVNIGNHMSVWEVCDDKTREVGRSIIKLPLGWFNSASTGRVAKAISTDINTLSHYPPIVLPEILTVLSSAFVIALALLFISLKYAIIIALMVPLMLYFWHKTIMVLQSLEEENVRSNQKMESTIVEFAQLQPVLRASGVLVSGWRRLEQALNDDKNAALETLGKKGRYMFGYMLVVNIGAIMILTLSAYELKNDVISLYTFVGIVVAMIRFANPLSGLLGYIAEVFNIRSALQRVESIINTKHLPESIQEVHIDASKGLDIVFKNVDFSYVAHTRVLKNINLSFSANSITALVGASGSGKSTINKLIARFWDVDSGEILIDGINIKNIKTEDLMSLTSMVFQEVYLFDTTIKENIAIAKSNASEEEIMIAAKKSGLDEVFKRLPNGWDTKVGEGGSLLSGGEKQRVSIARAFLKNAPILLLDEITSALDGINEAIITKSLEALSKNKTVVVIAHRLPSIKNANNIAVVDNGEIIAFDKHEKLIANCKKYQSFWQALSDSEDWTL